MSKQRYAPSLLNRPHTLVASVWKKSKSSIKKPPTYQKLVWNLQTFSISAGTKNLCNSDERLAT